MDTQWIARPVIFPFNLPFRRRPFLFGLFLLPLLVAGCKGDTQLDGASAKPAVDEQPPTLVQVMPVPSSTVDLEPEFTFETDEPGTIVASGSCSSLDTWAQSGFNTITLTGLQYGENSDCRIQVEDGSGNISEALTVPTFTIIRKRYLNDTGIVACGDYAYGHSGTHGNNLDCSQAGASQSISGTDADGDPVPAGQDAVYGRDAEPMTNDDSDGYAGFSFTRLDANGTPLAVQDGQWQEGGSAEAGTRWNCVEDNVTGLVWEVKTRDGGLHDSRWIYSWHDSDDSRNGGDAGVADDGSQSGLCYENGHCDTENFVADVNAQQLCGYSDWRLPTPEELLSITSKDRVSPAVDSRFFPNTESAYYWTSTSLSSNTSSAWLVNFYMGYEYTLGKNYTDRIRLVRKANQG